MAKSLQRQNQGSMTAVASSFLLIAAILGMGIFSMIQLFGGSKEMQSAVDAGNLNVATKALETPFVLIDKNSSSVRKQFLPLSKNGRISLLNINKVMAFELITQANLKSMRLKGTATQQAEENVKLLCDEAEKIAAELAAKLEDQNNFKAGFEDMANMNSVRMLSMAFGGAGEKLSMSEHKVSFVNRGEASNIHFDYQQVPANVRAVFQQNESKWFKKVGGRLYFRGYTDGIKVLDREIHFVPLYEGAEDPIAGTIKSFPHLISEKDFAKEMRPQEGSKPFSWKAAVPNAFRNQARITFEKAAKQIVYRQSCSVSNEREASDLIANGYIKIINPRGYSPVASLPTNDTIFNAELMSGIYLVNDSNGPVGFSTDPAALDALIAYNKEPGINTPPAIVDADGNPVFFDRAGNPVSDLSMLSGASTRGSACSCTNTMPAPGSEPEPACAQSLAAFFNAYPHKGLNLDTQDGSSELLAVEEARYQLFMTFQEAHKKWAALCAQGYTPQQANVKGLYPSVNTIFPYYSGLRKFDNYSIDGTINTPKMVFSTPGTVDDYLKQIALASKPATFKSKAADTKGHVLISSSWDRSTKADPAVQARIDRAMSELLVRVKELSPSATMMELKKLFQDKENALQLGTTAYLYLDADKNKLVLSRTAPPWASEIESSLRTVADGKADTIKSVTYHLLDYVVNAPHDTVHDVLFYVNPSYNSSALANDMLIWTESSGSNGVLGTVEFRNHCFNENNAQAAFYQPN